MTCFHFSDVLQDISQARTYMGIQLGDSIVIEKPTFPESFLDQGYGKGHIIGRYKGNYQSTFKYVMLKEVHLNKVFIEIKYLHSYRGEPSS